MHLARKGLDLDDGSFNEADWSLRFEIDDQERDVLDGIISPQLR